MATYAAKGDRFEENTIKSFAVDEKLIQRGTHEITNAEMLTMRSDNSTLGHLLLAAPGAGKMIELVSCLLHHHYVTASFAYCIPQFKIGTQVAAGFSRNLLEAGEDYIQRANPYTIRDNASLLINQPLYLRPLYNDPTLGGGSLSVRFTYRILDFFPDTVPS